MQTHPLPTARSALRLIRLATAPAVAAMMLAGCQMPPSALAQETAEPEPTAIVLAAVPPCADDLVATLSDGVRVEYDGADPADRETCLMRWNGRTHRSYAGFWYSGRTGKRSLGERRAIRAAMTGPVGTRAEFDDARAGLWGRVEVEHVGSPVLPVDGARRRTVLLRVVKHDARGRARVRAETLNWIDVRTGIALKKQSVTQLADGSRTAATTWAVERLVADAAS